VSATDAYEKYRKTFRETIKVLPGSGAAISLTLKEMELSFYPGGSYYTVVPLGSKYLTAQCRIRYEGTGLLQGFWTIDGMPFSPFNINLTPKKSVILQSSPIPSTDPGIHVLSIKLKSPKLIPEMDIEIPEILFFVSRKKRMLKVSYSPAEVIYPGNIQVKWTPLEGAKHYRLILGKTIKEIYQFRKKGKIISNNSFSLKLPPGKYLALVIAENEKNFPITSSQLFSFEVKANK